MARSRLCPWAAYPMRLSSGRRGRTSAVCRLRPGPITKRAANLFLIFEFMVNWSPIETLKIDDARLKASRHRYAVEALRFARAGVVLERHRTVRADLVRGHALPVGKVRAREQAARLSARAVTNYDVESSGLRAIDAQERRALAHEPGQIRPDGLIHQTEFSTEENLAVGLAREAGDAPVIRQELRAYERAVPSAVRVQPEKVRPHVRRKQGARPTRDEHLAVALQRQRGDGPERVTAVDGERRIERTVRVEAGHVRI